MGLFGRDKEEEATPDDAAPDPIEELEAPEASETGTEDPQEQEQEPGPSEAEPDDGPAPDPPEPEEPSLDVEEALKELSARMTVLSSNLEGVQDERSELEEKLGNVEERMTRLGSLAEAVSSEYNPFISENSPEEPSWTPEPEHEASGQAGSGPGPLPAGEREQPPESLPDAADLDGDALDVDGGSAPDEPEGSPKPEAADPSAAPEQEAGLNGEGEAELDRSQIDALEQAAAGAVARASREEPDPNEEAFSGLGASKPPEGLEENLLMLEWVGMMLDRVGRAGLMDLLDYYQTLGWLDASTKDRATRIAVGVEAPDRTGDGHWRGDIELHRRSLLALQRLQGEDVPAAELDALRLDLDRLFGG